MNTTHQVRIVAEVERATHAIALWIEATLRDLGVSQAEAHVLSFLAQHAESTIADLHTSFGHKRSTLTGILDRLEGRGWLTRGTHPRSRRLVAVELTATGRVAATQVDATLRVLEERLRTHVGAEEVATSLRVLQALIETMEEDLP